MFKTTLHSNKFLHLVVNIALSPLASVWSDSSQSCRDPVFVSDSSFSLNEYWNDAKQHNNVGDSSRDEGYLELQWDLPKDMSLAEKFVLRFDEFSSKHGRNITENVFKGATLTADQAECGFDHSCVYRIPMKSASHINFEPCTTYRVTIEVKSYEMVYCTNPTITTRKFTTNSRAPKAVRNVHFSNYEGSFWNAQLRWKPPETDSCIYRYIVSYAKDDRKSTFQNWYWQHAQLSSTSYNLTNLKRCAYYRFQIQAITSQGLKGKSVSESFRTSGCFATLPLAHSTGTSSSCRSSLGCETCSLLQNILMGLLSCFLFIFLT